jgi:hypothetical protein
MHRPPCRRRDHLRLLARRRDVLVRARGRDRSSAAIRWAAATLWLLAAAAFLLFLTFFAFDVVYD